MRSATGKSYGRGGGAVLGADPLLSGHSLLNINFIKILENEYKIRKKIYNF